MNPTTMIFRPSSLRASRTLSFVRGLTILGAAATWTLTTQAQQIEKIADTSLSLTAAAHTATTDIPDAPSAVLAAQQGTNAHSDETQTTPTQQTPNAPINSSNGGLKQTKRILGVFPNFRAVSVDTKLPPQTVKQKFTATAAQTFDYSDLPLIFVLAGVDQAENNTPQFHQGAAGYARYLWHNAADQIDENFWVQAILPSALHEDSRYYTLGRGSIPKRALYAFDRTFITRSDRGGNTFNFSEVIGSGAASGISATYYPGVDQTWTKVGQRWLQNGVIDGVTYMLQEFWPDINDKLFHQKD